MMEPTQVGHPTRGRYANDCTKEGKLIGKDARLKPHVLQNHRDIAIKRAAWMNKSVEPTKPFKKVGAYGEMMQKQAAMTIDGEQWILADTGASVDLANRKNMSDRERKSERKSEHSLSLQTAKGSTSANTQITRDLGKLGIKIQPHVLDDCPDVISVGRRCKREGFGFYWPPWSEKPYFTTPKRQERFL